MKCEEYQERISQSVDDELDEALSSELFFHLSSCGECKIFFRRVMQLRQAMLNATPLAVPPSLVPRVHPIASKMKFPISTDRLPIAQFWRKRISLSLSAALVLMVIISAVTVAVSSPFFFTPSLGVKKAQETVYVLQLPQVEVKEYDPNQTRFFSSPRVAENKVQKTVYVLQLPQVEVRGYDLNRTKFN